MAIRSTSGVGGRRGFLLALSVPAAALAACRRRVTGPPPTPSPRPDAESREQDIVVLPISIAAVRNYRLHPGVLPSITFLVDTEKPG